MMQNTDHHGSKNYVRSFNIQTCFAPHQCSLNLHHPLATRFHNPNKAGISFEPSRKWLVFSSLKNNSSYVFSKYSLFF